LSVPVLSSLSFRNLRTFFPLRGRLEHGRLFFVFPPPSPPSSFSFSPFFAGHVELKKCGSNDRKIKSRNCLSLYLFFHSFFFPPSSFSFPHRGFPSSFPLFLPARNEKGVIGKDSGRRSTLPPPPLSFILFPVLPSGKSCHSLPDLPSFFSPFSLRAGTLLLSIPSPPPPFPPSFFSFHPPSFFGDFFFWC